MKKYIQPIIAALNYLFAFAMPFTHVVGYGVSSIGFLLSWDFWKALKSEKLFLWLKIFMIYGIVRSVFSGQPNVGFTAMMGYFSHWLLPFVLGYGLAKTSAVKRAFWIYYITFFALMVLSILAYLGLFYKVIGSNFYLVNENLLKGGRSHIAFAALCLLLSFMSIGQILHNKIFNNNSKIFLGFAAVLSLGAILLTGSRGYYIAAALAYFSFGIFCIMKIKLINRRWLVSGLTGVILLIGGLYFISPDIRARINRTGMKDGSVHGRLSLYKIAFQEIKARPVFGFGPGQGIKQEKFVEMLPEKERWVKEFNHLHSFYLNFAADFGTAGMLILVIIMYIMLKRIWFIYNSQIGFNKALALGVLFGLTGILIGDAFDTLLRGPAVAMNIFWLFGLMAGKKEENN